MKTIAAAVAVLCMSSAHAAGPERKRVQSQHRSLENSNFKADGMFAPVFNMERRLESLSLSIPDSGSSMSMTSYAPTAVDDSKADADADAEADADADAEPDAEPDAVSG